MSFDVVLVFLLLTLNIFHTFSSVSIVDFELVNLSWAVLMHDVFFKFRVIVYVCRFISDMESQHISMGVYQR